MKHTYIIPQVSFETLNTQSSIMAGSGAPVTLMFGTGTTSKLGGDIHGD